VNNSRIVRRLQKRAGSVAVMQMSVWGVGVNAGIPRTIFIIYLDSEVVITRMWCVFTQSSTPVSFTNVHSTTSWSARRHGTTPHPSRPSCCFDRVNSTTCLPSRCTLAVGDLWRLKIQYTVHPNNSVPTDVPLERVQHWGHTFARATAFAR
jgi:hypothetical protein